MRDVRQSWGGQEAVVGRCRLQHSRAKRDLMLHAPLVCVVVNGLQVARAAQRAGADLKEGFEVGKDVTLDKEAGLWTVKSTDVSWGGREQGWHEEGVLACWEVWT